MSDVYDVVIIGGGTTGLSMALGPGMLTTITVRGVVDGAYVRAEGTDVILMAALASTA